MNGWMGADNITDYLGMELKCSLHHHHHHSVKLKVKPKSTAWFCDQRVKKCNYPFTSFNTSQAHLSSLVTNLFETGLKPIAFHTPNSTSMAFQCVGASGAVYVLH